MLSDSNHRGRHLASAFAAAIATGLTVAFVTGFAQAAILGWRLFARHQFIGYSRDFLWMSPLAHVLPVLTGVCLAVAAAIAMRGLGLKVDARRAAAGAALFVGTFSLTLLAPRLHPLAQGLIAVGVAVRGAPMLARWSPVRAIRTTAGLAIVVAVLAAVTLVSRRALERRVSASLTAAGTAAPNVLLIILDTVRAAGLSLYGYSQPTTPALEQWAKDGVKFEFAISSAPWTLPSHASMFTGLDAEKQTTNWRSPLGPQAHTLAEVLRDRGYMTAGFVANTLFTGHDSGLDQGFVHYDDNQISLEQISWSTPLMQTAVARSVRLSPNWRRALSAVRRFDLTIDPGVLTDRKSATTVTDEFLNWHSARRDPVRPFFAFLNYFDAHGSTPAPSRFQAQFTESHNKQNIYDAALRYLDEELDRLFKTLKERGELDRTIVVVTSDHGEYLGEHRLWGHGRGMHMEVLRVPLIIRFPPKVPRVTSVARVVSLTDLPATILELVGDEAVPIPGSSLSRFWNTEPASSDLARSFTTFSQDGWLPRARQRTALSVFDSALHWISTSEGTEELYRYREDAAEATNLALLPQFRLTLDSLRARSKR